MIKMIRYFNNDECARGEEGVAESGADFNGEREEDRGENERKDENDGGAEGENGVVIEEVADGVMDG